VRAERKKQTVEDSLQLPPDPSDACRQPDPEWLQKYRSAVEHELVKKYPLLKNHDLSAAWSVVRERLPAGPQEPAPNTPQRLRWLVFEEQAKILLVAASEEWRRDGIHLAAEEYKTPVAILLKRRFRSLQPDDLHDVWSDTVEALIRNVHKEGEKGFQQSGSLFAYLTRIAWCRAVDLLRSRAANRRELLLDESALATLSGAQTELDPGEQTELRRLVDEALRRLPDKQRLTMTLYLLHHPESEDMSFLTEEVNRTLGETLSVFAVKGNLKHARQKVREFLRNQGYAIGAGGDE
jgi:RNA polymerase sigma factor (sigma-70 family)